MKFKISTLVLTITLLFCLSVLNTYSQTIKTETDLPPSYRYKLTKEVPELFFDFPDASQRNIDSLRKTWYPMVVGHSVTQEIDFMKQAVCEKLPNGDKVYRLKLNCDAMLDVISFKELQLPIGASIYTIYPKKNLTFCLDSNPNFLQNRRIYGELTASIIIEYIQPRKVKGKPKIKTEFIRLKYAQNNIERDAQEEQQFGCNPLIQCPLSAYEGFPVSDDLKNLLATSVVKMHIYLA